ncbi:MAG: methylated-DNA--[protein]-cysteine S-methyltransferase [Pseudomonadota bacterium]
MSRAQTDALALENACRAISTEDAPRLERLAADAGKSAHHFHRLFKAHTGLTPKGFEAAVTGKRMVGALAKGPTVTDAAFAAGFSSLSRFYDAAAERLGLAPSSMLAGGHGEVIVTAQARVELGVVTAAFSRTGVAAITIADEAADGLGEIVARFRHAMIVDGGADFDAFMEAVLEGLSEPEKAAELPLDIRGTAFEARVWEALKKIPIGTTASYGEIAAAIGAPTAHRAVARACGSNAHAVAIPCHRVVRADGSLSGYRWGVSRKRALIDAEAEVRAV